jgi:hypothetical protein
MAPTRPTQPTSQTPYPDAGITHSAFVGREHRHDKCEACDEPLKGRDTTPVTVGVDHQYLVCPKCIRLARWPALLRNKERLLAEAKRAAKILIRAGLGDLTDG